MIVVSLCSVEGARLTKRQSFDLDFSVLDNLGLGPFGTILTQSPQSPPNAEVIPQAQASPPPDYFECFRSCPTTNEYNPVCGSDRVQYFNEQKFNCARRCGAREYIFS